MLQTRGRSQSSNTSFTVRQVPAAAAQDSCQPQLEFVLRATPSRQLGRSSQGHRLPGELEVTTWVTVSPTDEIQEKKRDKGQR